LPEVDCFYFAVAGCPLPDCLIPSLFFVLLISLSALFGRTLAPGNKFLQSYGKKGFALKKMAKSVNL
jgi:hypothetical protein